MLRPITVTKGDSKVTTSSFMTHLSGYFKETKGKDTFILSSSLQRDTPERPYTIFRNTSIHSQNWCNLRRQVSCLGPF